MAIFNTIYVVIIINEDVYIEILSCFLVLYLFKVITIFPLLNELEIVIIQYNLAEWIGFSKKFSKIFKKLIKITSFLVKISSIILVISGIIEIILYSNNEI